jgi:uncharacterized protein YneF (UPF0154 family)
MIILGIVIGLVIGIIIGYNMTTNKSDTTISTENAPNKVTETPVLKEYNTNPLYTEAFKKYKEEQIKQQEQRNIENHQLKVNILSVLLGANEELTALDIAPILKLTTQKTSALLMQLCQEKIVIRINRNNKSYYKLA